VNAGRCHTRVTPAVTAVTRGRDHRDHPWSDPWPGVWPCWRGRYDRYGTVDRPWFVREAPWFRGRPPWGNHGQQRWGPRSWPAASRTATVAITVDSTRYAPCPEGAWCTGLSCP